MRYIQVTDEYELEDMGLDPYDLAGAAEVVGKASGINILRGKELDTVALDDADNVVGALFTEFDGYVGEFSFDVVVLPDYQSKGIGKELTRIGMDSYGNYTEMGDVRIKLDVVNPRYAEYLIGQYDLKKEDEVFGHIILTDRLNTSSEDLFEGFLNSLMTDNNATLIESVLAGYRVICEPSEYD